MPLSSIRKSILLLIASPRHDGQKQSCSKVGDMTGGKTKHQQFPVPAPHPNS
tara:strand:+ start:200 stop:355 length:156 start_codon:yes stop_codon:yes gene_type:complete